MAFVWLKLATASSLFAKVHYPPESDISDLAASACALFPHWRLRPEEVAMRLVSDPCVDMPTPVEIEAALKRDILSVAASVAPRSWLVASSMAEPPVPSAPARLSFGGEGRGTIRDVGGKSSGSGQSSPAYSRGKSLPSVSQVVGPTFEIEARTVLGNFFRALCPWARGHSALATRKIMHGSSLREADILCCVEGDTLTPCLAQPGEGAGIVELPAPAVYAPALPPLPLPAEEKNSPSDATRKGPHKYFVAEAYSGQSEAKMDEKVVQLETLIEYLKRRWEDRHESVEGLPRVTDITQIVGAAALVFYSSEAARARQLQRAEELVARRAAQLPNLRRLATAGRLVVIVLEMGQAPNTHFQRAMALQSLRLQGIPEDMVRVQGG